MLKDSFRLSETMISGNLPIAFCSETSFFEIKDGFFSKMT